MEKEFVPYKQALALKELGFDEPCMAQYNGSNGFDGFGGNYRNSYFNYQDQVAAPLYQQAFRFFRKEYNLYSEIDLDSYKEPYLLKITIKQMDETNSFVTNSYYPNCINGIDTFNNNQYKEAELECFKKLIEIVKEKQK